MPRIGTHHEAMMDRLFAGFRARVDKDHFIGTPRNPLEELFPDGRQAVLRHRAEQRAGALNPHAVNHAAMIGAKIVWMLTLSAEMHIAQADPARQERASPDVAEVRRSDPAQRAGCDRQLDDKPMTGARSDRGAT